MDRCREARYYCGCVITPSDMHQFMGEHRPSLCIVPRSANRVAAAAAAAADQLSPQTAAAKIRAIPSSYSRTVPVGRFARLQFPTPPQFPGGRLQSIIVDWSRFASQPLYGPDADGQLHQTKANARYNQH